MPFVCHVCEKEFTNTPRSFMNVAVGETVSQTGIDRFTHYKAMPLCAACADDRNREMLKAVLLVAGILTCIAGVVFFVASSQFEGGPGRFLIGVGVLFEAIAMGCFFWFWRAVKASRR